MNIFTSHLEKSRKDGALWVTQRGLPPPHPPAPGLQPTPPQSPQLRHQPGGLLGRGGRQWLNLSSPHDPTALGYPRDRDSAPECGAKGEGRFWVGPVGGQEGLHTPHTLW